MPHLVLKDTMEFPIEDLIDIDFSRKIEAGFEKKNSENTDKGILSSK